MRNLLPKIWVGLALGLAVVVGLLAFADARAVGSTIGAFDWAYLPLVLGLTLLNYGLRFLKWHYYIRLIGARTIAWPDSLRIFVGGFPLALSPGKIAEPIKAIWLNQIAGVPVARGIPVVAAERISDGLAVLLLSSAGVVAYPAYWPGFAAVLVILLGVVVLSQVRPLAAWALGLADRLPALTRFTHHGREFSEGMYRLFGLRSTLVAVGLGTVSWLGEGIGFYLVLRGLGLEPSLHTASVAVFVLAFSTIVGAASSLPGGLGAAEVSITGMLALTLGLAQDVAASATLLIRFFTLWFGVALGLAVLFSSRRLLLMGLAAPSPAAENRP